MDILQNGKQSNSYPDEDLFVMMSFRKDNEEEAKEAFLVFYTRYKHLLWALCYKVCTKLNVNNGKEFAKYIFSNTMISIYNSPTYDSSKGKLSTWMSRIAYHEALDLIKEHNISDNNKSVPLNDDMLAITQNEDDVVEYNTPQKKILEDAINLLSEKDREILLTCIMHQEEKKHLSDGVLRELCNRYDTTSENIRQIKKRALDRVKSHITQNSDFLNN